MKQTIQKKIGNLSIERNQKFYLELLERKKQRQDRFYNELKHIFNVIASYFWIIIKIVGIALASSFVGLGSVEPIYLMNKAFGMGYATFASYAEAGLIGALLAFTLFKSSAESSTKNEIK